MKKNLLNIVVFQLGWFSCVLGAANNVPWFGPVVVFLAVLLHLYLVDRARPELALLVVAGCIGALFDTALVRLGWLTYPNGMLLPDTAPYWIVAMWLLFATTLNVSLRFLQGRFMVAVAFGAIGGPLAYLAGERLGGLEFFDRASALVALAVGWALVTPLLLEIAKRLRIRWTVSREVMHA